jgi:sugar phosphate isomerase/epimerase
MLVGMTAHGTDQWTRRGLLGTALAAASGRLLTAIPLAELKLGVTSDEIDDDPVKAADFLQRFGVHYAEVRNVYGKYNTAQPADMIRETRKIFDARQVHVSVVDTAFFRGAIPADDAALDRECKLLDAAMERGDIFGTKTLRIFAFMPKDGKTDDTSVYPRSYELLKEAASRARPRGFKLAVENLKGSYVQTGADSERLLKAVPDSNLGVTWDPNNAASVGEKSFPDGYRRLDPKRIFNVHLRDWRHKADGTVEWAAVGTGEFDNLSQLRGLRKDGYDGPLTLETHWRDPKGKAYSTETSLTALLKVIAKV